MENKREKQKNGRKEEREKEKRMNVEEKKEAVSVEQPEHPPWFDIDVPDDRKKNPLQGSLEKIE